MKFLNTNIFILGLFSIIFAACSSSTDTTVVTQPITLGSSVIVTNTFQSTTFTSGTEKPVEELFMVTAGSLAKTATVGSTVEFPAYLNGLYDIDISETTIKFTVVATASHATYGSLFRVLETGTFDRYYFTFTNAQNVTGFTSSNANVGLRIDSNKILVVEIKAGYDFKSGQTFTITLK